MQNSFFKLLNYEMTFAGITFQMYQVKNATKHCLFRFLTPRRHYCIVILHMYQRTLQEYDERGQETYYQKSSL